MYSKSISKKHRLLLIAVAVMMAGIFFFPIWKITLEAPQYPEGLSMLIWVNKLSGGSRFDLQNINLLNKYIGMAKIDQNTIPELIYMPYITFGILALVIFTVLLPKLFMVIFTFISMSGVSVAGLVDFYLWEYEYGHNLNPDAPIIVEGMTYQPPLIFCEQLLNITACSFPHVGGYLLAGSIGLLVYIIYSEIKEFKKAVV